MARCRRPSLRERERERERDILLYGSAGNVQRIHAAYYITIAKGPPSNASCSSRGNPGELTSQFVFLVCPWLFRSDIGCYCLQFLHLAPELWSFEGVRQIQQQPSSSPFPVVEGNLVRGPRKLRDLKSGMTGAALQQSLQNFRQCNMVSHQRVELPPLQTASEVRQLV